MVLEVALEEEDSAGESFKGTEDFLAPTSTYFEVVVSTVQRCSPWLSRAAPRIPRST